MTVYTILIRGRRDRRCSLGEARFLLQDELTFEQATEVLLRERPWRDIGSDGRMIEVIPEEEEPERTYSVRTYADGWEDR